VARRPQGPVRSPDKGAGFRRSDAARKLRGAGGMKGRPRLPPRFTALVSLAFAVQATTGCLSNEYRIPKDELARVVQLPPEARGQRVRVLQEVGERRSEAIAPTQPPRPWVGPRYPEPEVVVEGEPDVQVDGSFNINLSGGSHQGPPPPRGGGWHTPSARPGGSGWRGSGGGSGVSGGGGGGGDDLAVLAVVVAVAAVFVGVGLAATEGARFDGYTELRPEQPVHLKNAAGQELHLPLYALTSEQVAEATEVVVKDDEGYGLRLIERRPIDRVGGTFKVSLGSLFEPPAADDPRHEWLSGFASTTQIGGFFTPTWGLVGSLSLGLGSDGAGRTFHRHELGVELQALPLRVGPLALGGFGHAGAALVGTGDDLVSGSAVGGGLLLELAVSTRLAFSLRGGWTGTLLDEHDGWRGHGSITAGLAIY
jgi:hypothetical protein